MTIETLLASTNYSRREFLLAGLRTLGTISLGGIVSGCCSDPSCAKHVSQITTAQLLLNGNQVLPQLLWDIKQAANYIHVEMFLFELDNPGIEISNALIASAQRGLKVRVLMNFSKSFLTHVDAGPIQLLTEPMKQAGIEVINSDIDYHAAVGTDTDDVALQKDASNISATLSAFTPLVIDHRKLVTIDGRVAYLGSANFGREYLYHDPLNPLLEADDEAKDAATERWVKWRDGLVRFTGGIAPALDAYFRARWVLDGGGDYGTMPIITSPPLPPVPFTETKTATQFVDQYRIVASQPDGTPNQVLSLFIDEIQHATRSIFVENSYLYHPSIIQELINAKEARPELRIDLVMPSPSWIDFGPSGDWQQFQYQRLIPAGINVFEYQNHMTHLKVATFDGARAIVGSANMNYRSLENDKDFELVMHVDGGLASYIDTYVRDVDTLFSRQYTSSDLVDDLALSIAGPAALFLVATRDL